MKDIREIVQSALDAVFFGTVSVSPEELITDALPEEYITYSVVSGVYTHHANNLPIRRRDYVDVKWRGLDIRNKHSRMEEIESAMRGGWVCPAGTSIRPVPRRDGQIFWSHAGILA